MGREGRKVVSATSKYFPGVACLHRLLRPSPTREGEKERRAGSSVPYIASGVTVVSFRLLDELALEVNQHRL